MCENPTGFLAEKYKYIGHAHLKHFFSQKKKKRYGKISTFVHFSIAKTINNWSSCLLHSLSLLDNFTITIIEKKKNAAFLHMKNTVYRKEAKKKIQETVALQLDMIASM